jgi:hypothetical protein
LDLKINRLVTPDVNKKCNSGDKLARNDIAQERQGAS